MARRHTTAHEFARDSLREMILMGELAPGAPFVQVELARRLEISATPIREAMRDLVTEGWLEFDPHHGAVVRSVPRLELREIYMLRRTLEPMAAELAAKRQDWAALKAARSTLKDLKRVRNPLKRIILNKAFHEHILDASGSPRLAAIIVALQDGARLAVAVANMEVHAGAFAELVDRTHMAIVDALEAGDADAAAAATLEHLELTMAWVLDDEAPQSAPESGHVG
jgi:DNA-binding GntR family transcriptional regulator